MEGLAPHHLAIIPAGNRRWARSRQLDTVHGHAAGVLGLASVVAAAWDSGVDVVTVWLGSADEFGARRRVEIGVLADWLATDGAALLRRYHAGFDMLGLWEEVAPQLSVGADVMHDAAGESSKQLVLLCAFDGHRELLAAARRVDTTDPEVFRSALLTGHLPPMDLIIRTGDAGGLVSGFPLWFLDGAFFHFCPFPWPEFEIEDLNAAIEAWRRG